MSRGWKQELVEGLRQQRILAEPSTQRLRLQDAAPWFMTLLAAIAAWLAALLLVASSLFTLIDESWLAAASAGVLLLGLAVWLLRQSGIFVNQLGLALSLVGQGLLLLAAIQLELWSAYQQRPPALVAVLVALLMLLMPAAAVHRLACALIALVSGAVFVGLNVLLGLYGVLLAALAVLLWLQRKRWAAGRRATLCRALASAATLVALTLPMVELLDAAAARGLTWLYSLGAGALLLCVVVYLVHGQRLGLRLGAVGAALLAVGFGIQAPGLLVAAALWLAVFQAAERLWCVLVGLGAVLYLGVFYYSLHISLLHKSLLLMVGGALLLVLRWYLLRQSGDAHEV